MTFSARRIVIVLPFSSARMRLLSLKARQLTVFGESFFASPYSRESSRRCGMGFMTGIIGMRTEAVKCFLRRTYRRRRDFRPGTLSI